MGNQVDDTAISKNEVGRWRGRGVSGVFIRILVFKSQKFVNSYLDLRSRIMTKDGYMNTTPDSRWFQARGSK